MDIFMRKKRQKGKKAGKFRNLVWGIKSYTQKNEYKESFWNSI